MKENELKFIELVEASNSNFVIKLERVIKSQVLSQLSRPMLSELFGYWKENIDERFNTKAVCMNCANSLFNIVKSIAKKYFELKEIQKNELNIEEEIEINLLDYSNKNEEILKNNFIDIDEDKNTVTIDNQSIELNTEEEKIEYVDSELPEKNEIVEPTTEEKITKRGRPKNK